MSYFLWLILPFAPLVALLLFMRKRRRTVDYAEGQAFKAALPWWVGTIERFVVLGWGCLFSIAAWKIAVLVSGPPPPGPITSPGPIYVVLGIGAIILPLAFLCANAVSWIVPPLRNANERAFRGKDLSFKTINQGLIKFGLVSALAGLALVGIAAAKPWSW
jgi:hypothetical protein